MARGMLLLATASGVLASTEHDLEQSALLQTRSHFGIGKQAKFAQQDAVRDDEFEHALTSKSEKSCRAFMLNHAETIGEVKIGDYQDKLHGLDIFGTGAFEGLEIPDAAKLGMICADMEEEDWGWNPEEWTLASHTCKSEKEVKQMCLQALKDEGKFTARMAEKVVKLYEAEMNKKGLKWDDAIEEDVKDFKKFYSGRGASMLPKSWEDVNADVFHNLFVSFENILERVTASYYKNDGLKLGGEKPHTSLGNRLTAHIWEQRPMPFQESEAKDEGWERVGEEGCDARFGIRYRKNGFLTPTLMYSSAGHIAGMQFAFDSEQIKLYPQSNLNPGDEITDTGLEPKDGDYALTAYFMDPAKICTATAEDHESGSVGDRFWVLDPKSKGGYEKFPLRGTDAVPEKYAPSGCAATGFLFPGSPGMGTHWWKFGKFDDNGEPSNDGKCEDAGPLFLLYSRGELVAFGMTFVGFENRVVTTGGVRPTEIGNGRLSMTNGDIWEFARQPLNPFFFHEHHNPLCLKNFNQFDDAKDGGTVTTGTLHVFFHDPQDITCPDEPAQG